MNDTQTVSLTENLRAAADLLEAHPDLPPPYITTSSTGSTSLNWQLILESIHGLDLAGQKAAAAEIVRAIGGKWNKQESRGDRFYFERQHGNLYLTVVVQRDAVCERVVTGVETVTIPAKEATPERIEEREIVEWRCEPLLAEVSA